MRIAIGSLLVLMLGVSCSTPGSNVVKKEDVVTIDVVGEIVPAEVRVEPDLDQTEPSLDVLDVQLTEAIPTDTITTLCDPGEGCFLDKCAENSDCQSGWCVQHLGEGVCTVACQEECPPGWGCKQVTATGPDVAYICVSDHATLCRPCAAGGDCGGVAGGEFACVDYGDEGSFCGGPCGENDECPWGFSCLTAVTVDGIDILQCVADAGTCPCTDSSVALGLWTPCSNVGEAGTCEGKRVCGEGGLGECDAADPMAESCNGKDDDCDGLIDEPEQVGGDFVNLCDDGNECSTDTCQGEAGCKYEELSEGECKDGDPCTAGDHCDAGICIGLPIVCDDGDPCTNDLCDGFGGCTAEPNTAACDDGNPCTVNDSCDDGGCSGFQIDCECQSDVDCEGLEDGDLCTGTLYCDTAKLPFVCKVVPDSAVACPAPEGPEAVCLKSICNPGTGICESAPDHEGYACISGDPCTIGDTCVEGECVPGVAVGCDDGNPCTDDGCDSDDGCLHTPNSMECDDGNACTLSDQCQDGLCKYGALLDCTDDNLCTDDYCDPLLGCSHKLNIAPCDDEDICTTGDQCHLGACLPGNTLNCEDNNPCTSNTCHPETGCAFVPLEGICDDGNVCTQGDLCANGWCKPGGLLDCGDNNVCTDDSCDPVTGCQNPPNAQPCTDDNACTVGDGCQAGACVPGSVADCDDQNVCTSDSCDADSGCSNLAVPGACNDGNLCTVNDACLNGACVNGGFLECDDDNICTDDSCSPDAGCLFQPNAKPCDDGDPCSSGDHCAGGKCAADEVTDCDDQNPCTEDSCIENAGCENSNLVNGTECGADKVCIDGDCLSCGEINGSQTFGASGSIASFTVPDCVTALTVEAWGAQGGTFEGGKGARMKGLVTVISGETLNVAVGMQGTVDTCGGGVATGGGGGGSFVWRATDPTLPLMVAGGGGGGNGNWGNVSCRKGIDGVTGQNGTAGNGGHAAGGADGNGGAGNAPSGTGSGGGGWKSQGQNSTYGGGCTGGLPYPTLAGGKGGSSHGPGGDGGFGAGGGAVCGGGGGGGYSGGGGGQGSSCRAGVGGGGSYNSGSNQDNTAGVREGHGQVKISW